jgi:hypothetical protein
MGPGVGPGGIPGLGNRGYALEIPVVPERFASATMRAMASAVPSQSPADLLLRIGDCTRRASYGLGGRPGQQHRLSHGPRYMWMTARVRANSLGRCKLGHRVTVGAVGLLIMVVIPGAWGRQTAPDTYCVSASAGPEIHRYVGLEA